MTTSSWHGTLNGYRRHECRCDVCRAAVATARAAYRATNRERERAVRAAYRAANRERIAAYKRTWRAANPERERERAKARYAANNGGRLEQNARYRARRAAATTTPFTSEQLAARLSMFAGCWICGGEATQIDHVKPLAKGGPHMLANLRPICGPCNAAKGARW